MKDIIKSHPTFYQGVRFRSRLEARWACFFDQAGWQWEYEPIDLQGWTPTFRVEFPCSHSECPASHSLLVEVKPYYSISDFEGHRCMDFAYGVERGTSGSDPAHMFPADASAAFGINPSVTEWQMSHGAGGGIETIKRWVDGDLEQLWKAAGNIVQRRR